MMRRIFAGLGCLGWLCAVLDYWTDAQWSAAGFVGPAMITCALTCMAGSCAYGAAAIRSSTERTG